MAVDRVKQRRFSWSGLLAVLIAGGVVGVGLPYGIANFMPEKQAPRPPAVGAGQRSSTPQPPPKIEFLGPGRIAGTVASMPGNESKTVPLAIDDATVFWLRVTPSGTGGQGSPPGGPNNGQFTMPPPLPPGVQRVAPSGGGSGQGGRARRGRIPLSIRDEAGRQYSFSTEAVGDGIIAVHLKRGYDKKPAKLTVSQVRQDETIKTWEFKDIPAPKPVLMESLVRRATGGEVVLAKARGRVSCALNFEKPSGVSGVMIRPLAASYTPIDSARQQPMLAFGSEKSFSLPFACPNPEMARLMSFEVQTIEAVTTYETVTFHTARLDNRFGQPVFVVDRPEVVKTPSGLKVTLLQQDFGPKRQPRNPRTDVSFLLQYDLTGVKMAKVSGIAPHVSVETTAPAAQELGVSQIRVSASPKVVLDGEDVLSSSMTNAPAVKPSGVIHTGPIANLTVRLAIAQPRVKSKTTVVFPVNPKIANAN